MSLNLTIFISALVCLGTLAWVVFPLLRQSRAGGGAAMDELAREQADALLGSLGNLYQSQQEGQVSEEDFPNIERRLILELARIYHRQGIRPDALAEQKQEKGKHQCGSCGTGLTVGFRFCPTCGAQQKMAA